MIFKLNKIKNLIYRNTEITFLILLLIITITSTKFYNTRKLIVNENYKEIINNIYFQVLFTDIVGPYQHKRASKFTEFLVLPGTCVRSGLAHDYYTQNSGIHHV